MPIKVTESGSGTAAPLSVTSTLSTTQLGAATTTELSQAARNRKATVSPAFRFPSVAVLVMYAGVEFPAEALDQARCPPIGLLKEDEIVLL